MKGRGLRWRLNLCYWLRPQMSACWARTALIKIASPFGPPLFWCYFLK